MQAFALKTITLKKFFDIPNPPAEAPKLKMKNPFQFAADVLKKELSSNSATAEAEIVDGSQRPKRPASASSATGSEVGSGNGALGKAPVTFAMPPRKANK